MAQVPASVQATLVIFKRFWPEENKFIFEVYCPELGWGGSGDSKEEAEKDFRETMKENVVMAKVHRELEKTLLMLGWTEKDGQLTPPEIQVEKTTVTL